MKILEILAWLTIVSAFLLMVLFGFWFIYPYNDLDFTDDVFPVMEKQLQPGDMLVYTAGYCKKTDFVTDVSRTFVDGILLSTPTTIANNPPGCRTNIVQIEVPNVPAGNYRLRIVYQYHPNPIRTIQVTKYTELFIITK